jgi:hypothetical protein
VRIDLNSWMEKGEDFVRRHFKPRHVQEAEKRRTKARAQHAMRRFGAAAGVAGASGVGVLGFGLVVAPVAGPALLAVGAATAIAAGTALFWPKRYASQQKISRAELQALMLEAEAWLLEKRALLPGRALPALDSIFLRLGDIHPHLHRLEPNGTLAWELRRLLTEHLPRLVHSFAELPGTVTTGDPALLPKLIEGLETLDGELVRICREASSEHLLTFETQGVFLETRYGDGAGGGRRP